MYRSLNFPRDLIAPYLWQIWLQPYHITHRSGISRPLCDWKRKKSILKAQYGNGLACYITFTKLAHVALTVPSCPPLSCPGIEPSQANPTARQTSSALGCWAMHVVVLSCKNVLPSYLELIMALYNGIYHSCLTYALVQQYRMPTTIDFLFYSQYFTPVHCRLYRACFNFC